MSVNNKPLANLNFLQNFSKGNPQTIYKYIDIFLRNTPDLMVELKKQIAEKDYPSIEITAHSLKAQFNFIGFTEGENHARNIRNMAKERKDVLTLLIHFRLLEDLSQILYEELNTVKNSLI